ncbi:MAG: hypothetical protein JST90_15910 [Bacteroidetes bacterium]|nr:hypothetical protein [Bacteroidota bacterium]
MTTSSVTSLHFATRVGGVAFYSIAQPVDTVRDYIKKIEYVAQDKDGYRLRLITRGDTIYPYIPDWQLIPIAKYSNSTYNSCVSLFGPKSDSTHYDIVYQENLQNTLLGMRILQADMMLMDPYTLWELPKFNGETIKGIGEILPEESSSGIAAFEATTMLSSGSYQSWILTNDNPTINFSMDSHKLSFNTYPYYHFWKTDTASNSEYIEKVKQIEKAYSYDSITKSYVNLANAHNRLVKSQDSLIRVGNDFIEKYNKYPTAALKYEIEQISERIKSIEAEQKSIDKRVFSINQRIDYIAKLVEKIPSPKTITDSVSTEKMKYRFDLLLRLNQPVYEAVARTMQYSALFRYFKSINPLRWNEFLKKINTVQISPLVKTPTDLPKNTLKR